MTEMRLDKFLWAIRIFKTRSLAKDAIDGGKVKMDGTPLKASKAVKPGEIYDVRTPARKWTIRVKDIPVSRVDYEKSLLCYEDLTPPELLEKVLPSVFVDYTGKRISKQGRPTKRKRRDLDDFMGES